MKYVMWLLIRWLIVRSVQRKTETRAAVALAGATVTENRDG